MCFLLTVFSEFVHGPPLHGEHFCVLIGQGSRVNRVVHESSSFYYASYSQFLSRFVSEVAV
jgi:hypothetical protein